MPDKQYILVIGDPLNGFRFVGPFANALNFLTEQDIDGDWWIAELESPNDNP